jgi:hypothetical protein
MTTTTNLFAVAGEKKAASKKVSDKVRVEVSADMAAKIERLLSVRAEYENLEAEKKMLEGEVKESASEKWAAMFEEQGVRPASFFYGDIMVLPIDKYLTIDADRADELERKYPNITTCNEEFVFNPVLLQKYQQQISDALMAADIPTMEKAQLVQVSRKYSIVKGALDKLKQWGRVSEVMAAVSPIIQLKGGQQS